MKHTVYTVTHALASDVTSYCMHSLYSINISDLGTICGHQQILLSVYVFICNIQLWLGKIKITTLNNTKKSVFSDSVIFNLMVGGLHAHNGY